jgi:cytochrome c551/c552
MHRKFVYILIIFLTCIETKAQKQSTEEGGKLFQQHCASCHKAGKKLIGPDLTGIRDKRKEEWLISFIMNSMELIENGDPEALEIYKEYKKILMPPALLKSDEVISILNHIDTWTKQSPLLPDREKTPFVSRKKTGSRIFLITAAALLLLIFIYFLVSIILKRNTLLFNTCSIIYKLFHFLFRKISFSFYLIHFFIFLVIIFLILNRSQSKKVREIKQSIVFSHETHYLDNEIHCLFCHYPAHQKAYAGIPGKESCMKCHVYESSDPIKGKADLEQLYSYVSKKEDIPWKDHFSLMDHVHFNHALHVRTGRLECTDCHNDIVHIESQQGNFTMYWCIDCHKKEKIHLSNKYYLALPWENEKNSNFEYWKKSIHDLFGQNCCSCHY